MDDGSQFRHTTVSFLIALVFSMIAPIIGYFAAVQVGIWYEKGKTDEDSLSDIQYDRNGALYGSVLGSGIGGFLWYMVLFGSF